MPPEEDLTNLPDNDLPEGDSGAGVTGANENDSSTDESGDGQTQDGQVANPDDDTEEVEKDGTKYRIPKALKDAFLMQADYTRKTQETAEIRKAAEAERGRYLQANAEHVQALAGVHSLDQQLQQFQQLDWQKLSDEDPAYAQKLWIQYAQLKDTRQQLAGQVQQMEQQRAVDAQRFAAKQLEEGRAALAREIPNWSPEVAQQIHAFAAKEFGFQPQELQQVTDYRVVKMLHTAMVGAQLIKKQQDSASSKPQPAARPVTKVGGNSAPARRDINTLPVDDWMKARNEQLRKSKGR